MESAVKGHHLTVQLVESAKPKVPVGLQLAVGETTVVDGIEQGGEGRALIDLMRSVLVEVQPVAPVGVGGSGSGQPETVVVLGVGCGHHKPTLATEGTGNGRSLALGMMVNPMVSGPE